MKIMPHWYLKKRLKYSRTAQFSSILNDNFYSRRKIDFQIGGMVLAETRNRTPDKLQKLTRKSGKAGTLFLLSQKSHFLHKKITERYIWSKVSELNTEGMFENAC